ncbi:MAG: P83/100 family protein, partial [Spirochaetota bacterium]
MKSSLLIAAPSRPALPPLPCAVLGLLLASFPLAALEVAKDELASAQASTIAFVNYEGPQSVIESASAIKGIGTSLAQAIGAPRGTVARAGDTGRYSVIRAIDASEPEGLDADIIVIGADALVDHIANIRRIVAGYLEKAWGYSAKDASTLAIFITVYNAVHRGDMAYIGGKYKKVVSRELTAANAGLSKRWDEWPGASRILIPLSSGARQGAIGAVSTATISDKAVTEKLQAEPGAAVPERQALVDIKEKEVAQGQAEASKAKVEAKAADTALATAKDKLEAATTALEAAKKPEAAAPQSAATASAPVTTATAATKAATPATAAAPSTSPPVAAAAATGAPADKGASEAASVTVKPAEVAAAEKAVSEAQTVVAAATATAAEKNATAAKAEAAVAAKQSEVAADRAAIGQDQKAGIAAEVAGAGAAEASGIFLFEVVDAGYPFARIDFVDTKTGKLIRASVLNTIRARSVVDGGAIFVAIAG